MNRRDFLRVMGASTGAALAAGCERAGLPDFISQVLPGDTLPDEAKLVPGICTECPAGCAMTIKMRDGHPVKYEGNPALCMRGQASLSRLYHPGRLKSPLFRGKEIGWDEALANIEGALGKPGPHAFLSGRTTGALSELIDGFCQQRGVERLPEFEVYSYAAIRKANEIVFGKAAVPFYDVKQTNFLLTVGVDVIETFANPVQFARDLSEAHLKWVHVESYLSLTGINADERIVIRPGSEAEFLANLPEKVATALKRAKRPLVIANGSAALPAAKLQKELNSPLDFDRGLDYSHVGTPSDLDKLRDRSFGVLFIHDTDPVAYRPGFAEVKAAFRVGFGDLMNATLQGCDLVLPSADALPKLGATPVKLASPVTLPDVPTLLPPAQGPVLVVTPSIRTFDGRSDVLPLLSEIPDPLTTVTYGAWVTVAEDLKVKDGELIEFTVAGKTLRMPARTMPGQPAGVFTVQRPFLKGIALPLAENGEELTTLPLESARATGTKLELPVLSGGMRAEGRGILPEETHHEHHVNASLYPPHEHKDYRWAMAIDLDRCIGCGACVAACYVENNVPVVGPAEHLAGREMSWLRIEPFVNATNEYEFLPMMCQQCDHAPCEPVCPVLATYHTTEGLNAQVYNRCVGTRYCSNNCPYKVRRFNWIDHPLEKSQELMLNPDVSRRPRGVMEKCTFCVHRIRRAKDHAKDEKRLVRDGELTTACAETCPAQAIVFGNMLDKDSLVYRQAHDPRAYRVFDELGTEPAVYYLKTKVGHAIACRPDIPTTTTARNSVPYKANG
jgi:molybdopterin-containing oxidoreductase family iron-sulfur binding subunit